MRRIAVRSIALAAGALLMTAGIVLAADPPPATGVDQSQAAQASSQGPLLLQKSDDGFVVAPEFKYTRFDGKDVGMVGAYGGWLAGGRFLFGGGGYFTTQGHWGRNDSWDWNWNSNDRRMAYGGFVFGWSTGGPVQVGLRALAGFGRGRFDDQVTYQVQTWTGTGTSRKLVTTSQTEDYWRDVNFFVAEPQAEVIAKVTPWLSLTASAGYRAIASDRHDGGSDANRRLRGAVGSFSVRFGPF